jgi:hypothetical protein
MMNHKKMKSLPALSFLLGISIASASPLFAADGNKSAPADPTAACLTQYNSYVLRAKKSLAGGDRNSAIQFLLAARAQLGHCKKVDDSNSSGPVKLGSNSVRLTLDGTAARCS